MPTNKFWRTDRVSSDELDDWSDVREWLRNGTAPLPPSVLRKMLAERDALARACHEMQVELDLCRRKLRALSCTQCGGTGRKAVGQHETLQAEWVTDYAACDHGGTNAD